MLLDVHPRLKWMCIMTTDRDSINDLSVLSNQVLNIFLQLLIICYLKDAVKPLVSLQR